jgi:hypothetical protein
MAGFKFKEGDPALAGLTTPVRSADLRGRHRNLSASPQTASSTGGLGKKEGFAKVSWIFFIHKQYDICQNGYFLSTNIPIDYNIDIESFKGEIPNQIKL